MSDNRYLGLVLTLFVAVVVGIVFWHSPVLYPLKLLTVVLHEAGHAAATYAVGGSVDAISINQYQGGLTHCRFEPTLWRKVVVSSSGYLGSTVFGTLLLRGAARPRGPRVVLWVLGIGVLGLALLFFRDLFSWGFALGTSAFLMAVARWGPDAVVRPGARFIASFTCLYALFDLRDDVLHFPWEPARSGLSDADALAAILPIPALWWGILWSALSVWLIVWTLRSVLDGSGQTK